MMVYSDRSTDQPVLVAGWWLLPAAGLGLGIWALVIQMLWVLLFS